MSEEKLHELIQKRQKAEQEAKAIQEQIREHLKLMERQKIEARPKGLIKLEFGVPHGYRDSDGEFVKSTKTVEHGTFSSEEKAAKFFFDLVTAKNWNKFDKPNEFFTYEDCLEIIQMRQDRVIGGVKMAWKRYLSITDIVANDPVYTLT